MSAKHDVAPYSSFTEDDDGSNHGPRIGEWELPHSGFEEISYLGESQSVAGSLKEPVSGTGILIVSGAEEESAQGEEGHDVPIEHVYQRASDLSMPGSESIPTELESLDLGMNRRGIRNIFMDSSEASTAATDYQNLRRMTILGLAAVVVAVIAILTAVYVSLDRSSWKATAQFLEQEVKELVTKYEDLEAKYNASTSVAFDWDVSGEEAHKAVLLNNCWLTAEANVKFGECANSAKDGFWDFSSRVWEKAEKMGTYAKDSFDETYYAGDDPIQMSTVSFEALNEASRAFTSAAGALSSIFVDATQKASDLIDSSVVYAVEQTRDAIEDASLAGHVK